MKLLAFAFLVSASMLHAQQVDFLSPELRYTLKSVQPGEKIDIYLRGNLSPLAAYVRANNGRIKGSINNQILSCALPAEAFEGLNNIEGLEYVEYSGGQPQMLNELMLTNNNVHPVHQGAAPLPQPIFGADVIMGFVDSGIELNHPDFQNSDGSTRVLAIWDQTQDESIPFRIPEPYGYGQEWTLEDINQGITGHDDQASFYGHGSTVAGVGAGNANATGDFLGVAPEADIIMVSSDFNRPNWTASVADAIEYIFEKADALGMPAVVNLSLGDYYGSHDGLDAPALHIDQMLEASPGRVVVAAAGNSGNLGPYHLSYDIPLSDTAFTWFQYNPAALGTGAVFFEVWTDIADFESAKYTIGADLTVPSYAFKGYANWRTATENLNVVIKDTIFNNGNILGIVESWCGQRGDQYHIQMVLTQPFSNQYLWRFASTGGGTFDIWSYAPFGTSKIVTENLPDVGSFPDMVNYRYPDTDKTIVDSWVCSDKVITVGNYINRNSFVNYLGTTTTYNVTPGEIAISSSRGPTRDNRQKPDIAASGDNTLSAGRIATLNSYINNQPTKVAQSGMHYINGGTSLASPVVAGAACLYLSINPSSAHPEIKAAIVDNALADQFTGVLPGQQFGYGKLDVFAAVSEALTVSETRNSAAPKLVQAYPNPTYNNVQILSSGAEIINVEVFDVSGRALLRIAYPKATKITLPLIDLPGGIFVAVVNHTDGTQSRLKLILEK